MLPEKTFTAIEKSEAAGYDFVPERNDAGIYSKRRKKRALLFPVSTFLSLAVALAAVGFSIPVFKSNCRDLAAAAFELMLRANFPSRAPADVPAASFSDAPPPETTEDIPAQISEPEPETEKEEQASVIYDYDHSAVPEGCFPIIPTDLSLPELGRYYISNETPYNPDMEALSSPSRAVFAYNDGSDPSAPRVLILHTHATEAYSEEGALWYDADGEVSPRTENTAENVVAIGSVMTKVLRENGVPMLHCTILHDKESYMGSYDRAAETIRSYLEKYPTIEYVFDVHRDSLIRENGEKLRPITEIDGKAAAQVMCVVGTDCLGAYHPFWEDNLSLAAALGARLDEAYPGLARHIYLRGASFNQQYAPGSLLIEIGSCGNSPDEAKYSAGLVAAELAKIIKGE